MKGLFFAALLLSAPLVAAQTPPQMPLPTKEHEWLHRFVGDWEADVEVFMEPGKPPIKSKSTEVARTVGGFWVLAQGTGDAAGTPYHSVLTLGYDPEKKKYVGTWIDSMTSTLWKYDGTVDASGNILTLETEGPWPGKPGQITKFKEVTEFKSDDHRVFTSSILAENGQWMTIVTVDSHKRK